MFRNVKRKDSHMSIDLEEPLTGQACSQLVIEFVKYIMYQKQQIPLSCDSLIKLHANSKPTDRNFSSTQSLVNSWCNVSDQLASQFCIAGCDVKEILIVIGATIVSPKLCIKFELPSHILSSSTHVDYQHSFRKPLLNVMRSFLQWTDFQDEMTVPLGPTNTFVLIQKRDPRKISEFFIPKPQFTLSSLNTQFFHVQLNYNGGSQLHCNCENLIKVFHDDRENCPEDACVREISNCESKVSYQWYQSKEVFKGFKFLR